MKRFRWKKRQARVNQRAAVKAEVQALPEETKVVAAIDNVDPFERLYSVYDTSWTGKRGGLQPIDPNGLYLVYVFKSARSSTVLARRRLRLDGNYETAQKEIRTILDEARKAVVHRKTGNRGLEEFADKFGNDSIEVVSEGVVLGSKLKEALKRLHATNPAIRGKVLPFYDEKTDAETGEDTVIDIVTETTTSPVQTQPTSEFTRSDSYLETLSDMQIVHIRDVAQRIIDQRRADYEQKLNVLLGNTNG